MQSKIYLPGPQDNTVRDPNGKVIPYPEGWGFLMPGDATMTRRVKQAGDHWVLEEWHRNKRFGRGIVAPAATIERIRAELQAERATETYAKQKAAGAKRREKTQTQYVEDFAGAVLAFLNFHPGHADLAQRLAKAVTEHATPVGSGTVARTKRIPIEKRAEAAVIAWMRHQTTGYDSLVIPRIKGMRRETRRRLAERSRELLNAYRKGDPAPPTCPLQIALSSPT